MLERRKTRRGLRIGSLGLAALAHGAALALILVPALLWKAASEPEVVSFGPLVYVKPVAPKLGGGGSPVVKPGPKATPAKPIATPDFVQPQVIPEATPVPESSPADIAQAPAGGEIPGIPGLPEGPGSPDGHPDSECLENCTPGGLPGGSNPVPFVLAPVALSQTRPAYPANARALGLTGAVTVEILVGVDGRVQHAKVVKGQEPFAAATLAAVKNWRYAPVIAEGKPIVWKSTITVKFQLDGSGRPK